MENKEKQIMHEKNTSDFKSMKSMLTDIEIGIMQKDPLQQYVFYRPIQELILEAWLDIGGYKQDHINNIINGK